MIKVLQKFECYVDEVYEDSCLVVLKDITNSELPDECAEIDFGLKPSRGEIFYLTIEQFEDGLTFSVIYFPYNVWTKEEIDKIMNTTKEWEDLFLA